jgi:beta-lactamase superfamily II metal-dependent hydrolase
MKRTFLPLFAVLIAAITLTAWVQSPPLEQGRRVATPVSTDTGTLTAYFFDVDQGDAILLVGPDFTILIDAGRHDRNDVLPHLEQVGIESIDLMVGTHPHADHIGQFVEVLEAYPVGEVWMSGDINTSATFENTIDAIAASGAAYHEPRAGEVYEIGSARLEVVNPTHIGDDANDGSVAFRLIFGDVAFMFTGDAELAAEAEMVASGLDLRAQILKLGHHGSDTSSSLRFLQAVAPEVAIWSAGTDNTYGHPHRSTLNRLARLGIEVHGTAKESTIIVCTNGQTYKVGDCENTEPALSVLLPGLSVSPPVSPLTTRTATTISPVTPTATVKPRLTPTPSATAIHSGAPTLTLTLTLTLLLTPIPTSTELSSGPCSCASNLYNCTDFGSQHQAQACFDYCVSQGAGDIHRIDGADRDGRACETLQNNYVVPQ